MCMYARTYRCRSAFWFACLGNPFKSVAAVRAHDNPRKPSSTAAETRGVRSGSGAICLCEQSLDCLPDALAQGRGPCYRPWLRFKLLACAKRRFEPPFPLFSQQREL
mmetsp:Transcript_3704/g.6345  ORF Transcript_3704/g.6345 Transcript_3704/m.6345 type:complete len:107 (+) Transcript_3704:235-555(+)